MRRAASAARFVLGLCEYFQLSSIAPSATIKLKTKADPPRVFKSAWFAKRARKEGITDSELRRAAKEAMQGQADDLGGGVFKKRLNENRHRSILLTKADGF